MKLDQITNGELSILQVLWQQRQTATTREITAALHDEVTDPRMASVQKLLERLEAKGCVHRDRRERAHRYRPLVSQEAFLQSRMQALADRVCNGTLVPLVTTLLRSEGLTPGERERLRMLVDTCWPLRPSGTQTLE